jgi:hypothetical protein
MTVTLTQQDKQLLKALETAVSRLQEECRKKVILACDVRAILFDISADALASLPVPVQVLLPPNTAAIMDGKAMYDMVHTLKDFKGTLG